MVKGLLTPEVASPLQKQYLTRSNKDSIVFRLRLTCIRVRWGVVSFNIEEARRNYKRSKFKQAWGDKATHAGCVFPWPPDSAIVCTNPPWMLELTIKRWKQHSNDSEGRSLKAWSSAIESTLYLCQQHSYQSLTAPCVDLFKRYTPPSLNWINARLFLEERVVSDESSCPLEELYTPTARSSLESNTLFDTLFHLGP